MPLKSGSVGSIASLQMITTPMASAFFSPSYLFSFSSPTIPKSTLYTLSISLTSDPKVPNFRSSTWTSQLDLSPFSPWDGLKQLVVSIPHHSVKFERKGKYKSKGVHASLFGVGAPEALVIGVVALLVFGPKGLAEVARNLGRTLRAFQPTIKELQDVSREFKSTLEREIGLDDIQSSIQSTYTSNTANTTSSSSSTASPSSQMELDPNGSPSPNKALSSEEEYLKIREEQLKGSAAQKQAQTASPEESQSGPQSQSQGTVSGTAAVMPSSPKPESET